MVDRKLAASVIGPLMVTDAGLFAPVYEPAPVPLHPENVNPAFGVAVIETLLPASRKPEEGLTRPPGPALIVS